LIQILYIYLSGTNSFSLTPRRWIEATNATGLIAKTGRYGATLSPQQKTISMLMKQTYSMLRCLVKLPNNGGKNIIRKRE
jgi:hypothetical protein